MAPVSCCIFWSSVMAASSRRARSFATASLAASLPAAVWRATMEARIQALPVPGAPAPPPQAAMPAASATPTARATALLRHADGVFMSVSSLWKEKGPSGRAPRDDGEAHVERDLLRYRRAGDARDHAQRRLAADARAVHAHAGQGRRGVGREGLVAEADHAHVFGHGDALLRRPGQH